MQKYQNTGVTQNNGKIYHQHLFWYHSIIELNEWSEYTQPTCVTAFDLFDEQGSTFNKMFN